MMTIMPGLGGSSVADLDCGVRVSPGGMPEARRRRYPATTKNAAPAIRAAPPIETTIGHQRKPAEEPPPPPPGGAAGAYRVTGSAPIGVATKELPPGGFNIF